MHSQDRNLFLALVVWTISTIFLSNDAAAYYPQLSNITVTAPPSRRLIVKVKSTAYQLAAGTANSRIEALAAVTREYGAPQIEPLAPDEVVINGKLRGPAGTPCPATNVFVFVYAEQIDMEAMRRRLESQSWVEYVEEDLVMQLFATPDDPLFAWQWGLENTGQTIPVVVRIDGPDNDTLAWVSGAPGADVNFRAAYEYAGPRVPVLVGILDTGIDTDHEDIADNLWENAGEIPDNAIDDDHNGYIDDYIGYDFSGDDFKLPNDIVPDADVADSVGHGTHTAGIVAAVADNASGVAGLTPDCRIMTLKVFPNAFFSVIARAIYYGVNNGADILNLSFGGSSYSKTVSDALAYARAQGVLPIASSGNSGTEAEYYPSADTSVISVGAIDYLGHVAEFSSYGPYLDMVAPGVSILSLRAAGTDLYAGSGEPGIHIIADKYLLADGTSMAAPYVAGCAAALLSIEGGMKPERLREVLENSCVDVVDPYGDGESYPGWDKYSGFGRVNLGRALNELAGVSLRIASPPANNILTGVTPIAGSAFGPAFTGYQLDYGPGIRPTTWKNLISSNEPVIDGLLANWNTSALNGPYTLRLSSPSGHEDRVSFMLANTTVTRIAAPEDGDTVSLTRIVHGTSIAPDYRLTTVSIAPESDPGNEEIIWSGSAPTVNDAICTWVVDLTIDGWYYLTLRTQTQSATLADTVLVYVRNPFHTGWPVTLPDYGFYAPVADDLDGDGEQEFVIPTMSGLYVFNADGTMAEGWPRDTEVEFSSVPAIANLDTLHHQYKQIIITSKNYLHVFTHDGQNFAKPQSLWPRAYAGNSLLYGTGMPLICDLKENFAGTGRPYILVVGNDGLVHAYDLFGIEYMFRPEYYPLTVDVSSTQYISIPRATVLDLDCAYGPDPAVDGRNELVVAADGLWVWHAKSGKPYGGAGHNPRIRDYEASYGMAVGDFDGERGFEIAVAYVPAGSHIFHLDVLKADGTSLPGWPVSTGFSDEHFLMHTLCAGDADGDGLPEIFLAPYFMGGGYILAYRADGTPLLPGSENGAFLALEGSSSPITLADLTGDGHPEIVLKAGDFFSGPEFIFALTADGEFVPGYPLQYSGGFGTQLAPPLTLDLDGDGHMNLLTLESSGLVATAWDFPYKYSPAGRPWPKFRRDNWNSGILPEPFDYNATYIIFLIQYMYRNAEAHFPPYATPDTDCDGVVGMMDLVRLINYVYRMGPKPCMP